VVQFAEGVKDGRDYAIKFFLDRSAFIAEAALYAMCDPRIRSRVSPEVRARADAAAGQGMDGQEAVPLSQVGARFLPRVDAVRDGMAEGFYEDRQWKFLPPCIVMEKGESLQDWSERAKPDFFAALAVRNSITVLHREPGWPVDCVFHKQRGKTRAPDLVLSAIVRWTTVGMQTARRWPR